MYVLCEIFCRFFFSSCNSFEWCLSFIGRHFIIVVAHGMLQLNAVQSSYSRNLKRICVEVY